MRVALLIVFCFCITSTNPSRVFAETPTEKIGVIVLHPKWSMPAKILSDCQWYGLEEKFRKFQTWCGTGPWVCSEDKKIVGNKRNDSSILTIDLYEKGFLVTSPQCAWSKFKKYSLPVDKSSTTTTLCPSSIKRSTKLLPINPAPPITIHFIIYPQTQLYLLVLSNLVLV